MNRYAYAVNSPANWVDPSGYFMEMIEAEGGGHGRPKYKGQSFAAPLPGPSGERLPTPDEVLFIQWLFDMHEDGYGFWTQMEMRRFQREQGIPVDDETRIGPITWAYLLDLFADRVAADALGRRPVTPDRLPHQPGGHESLSSGMWVEVDFLFKQEVFVSAADNLAMSGMSEGERGSYLLCLLEEKDFGSPGALGCYGKWPERFGEFEAVPSELIADGFLEAAGWAGAGALSRGASKALKSATGAQDPVGVGTGGQAVPTKVGPVLRHIEAKGSPPHGHKGGGKWENLRGQLPTADSKGNSITYREWDVDPKVKGVRRNTERLVTGSDGSVYYTGDHYETFVRIK